MKTTLASLLFALSAISTRHPQWPANDHTGHGSMSSHHSTAVATKMVDGQVKKIDKAAGKVTLAHGPLANLGMDIHPMTMVFRVKDATWLDQNEGRRQNPLHGRQREWRAITVVQFRQG